MECYFENTCFGYEQWLALNIPIYIRKVMIEKQTRLMTGRNPLKYMDYQTTKRELSSFIYRMV